DGIFAHTPGTGTVSVGTGTGGRLIGAVSGQTNGIEAAGGAKVQVFTGSNVTGVTGVGILAQSTGAGGPVNVDATGGTIAGGAGGIKATTTNANVVNVLNNDVVAASGGNGIDAESGSGVVTVTSTGASIGAANDGIFASSTGAINITNSSAIL